MHRLTVLIAVCSFSVALHAPAQSLRAGAATANITPFLGSPIVGNFTEPPAQRIHDELHARCIVLDDGRTRLAFVVCDNVGIPREVFDQAKRLIQKSTGLPPSNVLTSSTHTHSATSARSRNALKPEPTLTEYQTFVARRIDQAVRCATANLEPARLAYGSADEPRPLFNRRYKMKPGTELLSPFGQPELVKMNPGAGNPNVLEPAGPTDPQISFLSVQSANGRPIALLANYSLHYIGGVGNNTISADYFAAFADRIQQLLGADRLDPPFVGILSNGTSGDVNNINVLGPRLTQRLKPFEQIHTIANMLADDVYKAHQSIQFHDTVPLKALTRELTLKTRKPTPEMLDRAKKLLAGTVSSDPKRPHEEAYAKRIIDLADSPDEVSIPLQTFRVGDVGIAAIPFEVFTQSGLDIKSRSPLKPTFTIELANGAYGYLPTPEQHALGGYETWLGTNKVEIQTAPKIVDAIVQMFEDLK